MQVGYYSDVAHGQQQNGFKVMPAEETTSISTEQSTQNQH